MTLVSRAYCDRLHRFRGLVKWKSDVVLYAPLYGRKLQSRASVRAVLCHVLHDINAAREGKATYEQKLHIHDNTDAFTSQVSS